MSSPLISGGPLLSLRCLSLVRHCLCLLIRVVDWCVSLLVRLICCWIILTASSAGRLDLLLTCHLSASLTTFAFRLREVRHFLLDLDPYGPTGTLGVFPLFLRELPMLWPPVFCSFPPCWRQANVAPIPKGQPSSVANYRPISIISVLSKVFERLVSVYLG